MNRLTLLLLTSLAPISWGTTYLVTTEMLPAGHPLLAGLLPVSYTHLTLPTKA